MTHLLVRVWRRKGPEGDWERVAGPLPVYDAVRMEAEANETAKAGGSGWQYTSFPVGENPNRNE